jgi:hypothetical protein
MAPLMPPRRHKAPSWMRAPLGRLQSPTIAWPQAWAALLLLATGLAHIIRALSHWSFNIGVILIGLFGFCYFLIGLMLRAPNKRALFYGVGVPSVGLALGTISFITAFDREVGVSWFAVTTLMVDVIIIPLCLAGIWRLR